MDGFKNISQLALSLALWCYIENRFVCSETRRKEMARQKIFVKFKFAQD